jgi:prophage DNA circulation protein
MDEFEQILTRLLDNLSAATASSGEQGAELRRRIGVMRADFMKQVNSGTFANELLTIFTLSQSANVALHGLVTVHDDLFAETPQDQIAKALVTSSIIFCLSTETRIIVAMEFTSRDDVEAMMVRMKDAFEIARELAVEDKESGAYETLTYMSGSLTNHLATTARPLPRMITFTVGKPLPALTLSNRIYYDATRWEEIVEENKTIHPAFCQRTIRGLSA